MIIRKFCIECDDETVHQLYADGPTTADLYSTCLACIARDDAEDKTDRDED